MVNIMCRIIRMRRATRQSIIENIILKADMRAVRGMALRLAIISTRHHIRNLLIQNDNRRVSVISMQKASIEAKLDIKEKVAIIANNPLVLIVRCESPVL